MFTIGLCRVFSLGGWARRFQSGFLVPRSTQDTARLINLTSTGLSPSMDILSRIFLFSLFRHIAVLQPRSRRNGYGLGCADFARHYSRYHCCFLFLLLLRCFSSPRSLHAWHGGRPSAGRVVPFGDPRIKGHLHLHAAFRSLSRPSSPE